MKFLRNMIKFWFFVTLVIMGVYVGIHNKELIQISLPPLVPAITVPSFVALSVAFLLGAFVSTIWFIQDTFLKHFKIRKLAKRLQQYELQNPEMNQEPFFKSESKNGYRND